MGESWIVLRLFGCEEPANTSKAEDGIHYSVLGRRKEIGNGNLKVLSIFTKHVPDAEILSSTTNFEESTSFDAVIPGHKIMQVSPDACPSCRTTLLLIVVHKKEKAAQQPCRNPQTGNQGIIPAKARCYRIPDLPRPQEEMMSYENLGVKPVADNASNNARPTCAFCQETGILCVYHVSETASMMQQVSKSSAGYQLSRAC